MWKPDGLQSAEMRLLKSASGGFWDVGKSINKWMKREWIQEKKIDSERPPQILPKNMFRVCCSSRLGLH